MKLKTVLTLIPILLSVLLISGGGCSFSAETTAQKRIQFHVVTVEEKSNQRNILSQTTIEGFAGTDFNINLQTGNFKMQADFLSDLVESNKLKIRAKLNTRRFYGYSPINLPLYEEDAQNHTMLLGFDETIVLLPFGRNGGAETLKIEITPTLLSDVAESEKSIKINIDKPLQGGEIYIGASKIPHQFEVEAILLADGREVARGFKKVLFDEEQEIALMPNAKAETEILERPVIAKIKLDKFNRTRPRDTFGFSYKFYRAKGQSENQIEILTNGAGDGTALGDDLVYQLNKSQFSSNKKYELKLNVRLAPGEKSE